MVNYKVLAEKIEILISKMLEKHPDMGLGYTIIPTLWTDGDYEIECRYAISHENGDATVYYYHYYSCESTREGLLDEFFYGIKHYDSSQLINHTELKKKLEKQKEYEYNKSNR